ncbi:sulfatase [Planctomycetota bacterium]
MGSTQQGRPVSRRAFLGSAAAGVGALALSRPGAAGDGGPPRRRRPNFVVIFADDQGYQDIGCFGSPDIRTPHLDRMAAEGRKFTDFYVAASVCSPSRAALLTGCYPTRVSVPGVLFPRSNTGLSDKEATIAKVLKARGYATACIGKWHLGFQQQFLPTRHGFDSYYGIPYSNDMWLAPNMEFADDAKLPEGATVEELKKGPRQRNAVPLMRDEKVIEYPADQATLTKRYTEEAVKFITANKDKPFFVYLPHTMPHIPLFASKAFKGKSKRGLYGDTIEEIDWSTGQILEAIRKLGIEKDTCVVYTSDNGPWLSKKAHGGSALPLRDGKFSVYEGGMREPCIMWWPGRIPAGTTCSELATTMDLLPTFAKLAGAEPPKDTIIDGKDIWPLMAGTAGAKTPHEAFFYFRGHGLQAVRSGDWKLHLGRKGKKRQAPGQLYNLRDDIGEKTNVADKHPDVVKRLEALAAKMKAHMQENRRPCGKVG